MRSTFIEQIHTDPLHRIPVGARVAVIGCGNTSIDAATQARRLGAEEVVVIYRRGEHDMSAYAFEYDLAKRDGATFLFHHAPVEVLGERRPRHRIASRADAIQLQRRARVRSRFGSHGAVRHGSQGRRSAKTE